MLVLGRKLGQTILIGPDIQVTVLEVDGNEVKLGIEAPRSVSILRLEIVEQVKAENRRACQTHLPDVARRIAGLGRVSQVGQSSLQPGPNPGLSREPHKTS